MDYVNHDLAYAFINPNSKMNIPLEFMLNVEFNRNIFLDETIPFRVYMFHYFAGFVKAVLHTKHGLDIEDVVWKRIIYTEYNSFGEEMGQKISGLKVSFRKGNVIYVTNLKFGDQYRQPIGLSKNDFLELDKFYARKRIYIKNTPIFLNEYNVQRVDPWIKQASSGNNPYEIYVEKIYSGRLTTLFPFIKGHKNDFFKPVKTAKYAESYRKIGDMFSQMKTASNRPWIIENELLPFLTLEYKALMSPENKFFKLWKGGQQAFMHGSLAHLKNSHNIEVAAQGREYELQMDFYQIFDNENLDRGMEEPMFFSVVFFDSTVELAAAKLALPRDMIRPLKPLNGPIKSGYKALVSFASDDTKAHGIVSKKPLKIERPENMINSVNSILKSKELLKDPSLMEQSEILLYKEIRKVLPENRKFSIAEWSFVGRYIAGMLSNSKVQKMSLFRLQKTSGTFPGSINYMVKNKETGVNMIFSINEQHIQHNEIDMIDSRVKVENFLSKQRDDVHSKDTIVFHFFVRPKHTIDDYYTFDEDSADFLHVDIVAQATSMHELLTTDMKKITPFDMKAMLTDHQIDKQTLSKMFDVMFNENSDLIDTKENFKAFIDGLFHNLHDTVKNLYTMPKAYSRQQVTMLGEIPVTVNFALDLPFQETVEASEYGHKMLVESKPIGKLKSQTFITVVYNRNSNEEISKTVTLLRTKVVPQEKAAPGIVVKKGEQRQSMLQLLWKINQLMWQYAWNKCKQRIFKRSKTSSSTDQCTYKAMNEIEDRKPSIYEIHATKLSNLGHHVMNGLLLRDIVADLIHWDIDGLKNDAIFLGASAVSSFTAQSLEKLGASALLNGNKVLGHFTKVTSTIVGKSVLLYYVIRDLVDNWHLVKNSTLAKVSVGSDAAILTMEGIDLTATALEGLGFVAAEASAVTGPLAGVTAAVLLLGTNVYQAVDKVSQIDDQIELSASERFVEGLLAFAHLNPEDKISKLLDEKIQNEAIYGAAIDFLQRHEFVKNYVAQVGGEHNFIDLRTKVPLLRSRASIEKQANTFCQSHGTAEPRHEGIWQNIKAKFLSKKQQEILDYNCTNSLGVSFEVDPANVTGATFYQLGTGNDTVFGFQKSLNIFNISSGYKEIHAGMGDDIFLLNGWSIFGFVNAYEGFNSIDMSGLVKKGVVNIASYADVLYIYYDKDTIHFLKMKNIQGITGRVNATDKLHLNCNHKVINLQGGENSDLRDYIFISDESCSFETRITLGGHSKILHEASKGKFTYQIMSNSNTRIIIQERATTSQYFVFDQPFTDIQNLTVRKSSNSYELQFELTNGTIMSLELARSLNKAHFSFADNVSMSLNSDGYPIARLKTAKATNIILDEYSETTKKLQVTLIVKITNGQILTLNHGQYTLGDENSHEKFTILHNDPDHAIHIEEGTGNHVLILNAKNDTLNNVSIDMNRENVNANLTIDFTPIIATLPLSERLELEVNCESSKKCSDLHMAVIVLNDSHQFRLMGQISIHNANLNRINILKNLPLTFDLVGNISCLNLVPLPLYYPGSASLIIISQEMIERYTRIIIAKNEHILSQYRLNDTLVFTNIEHCMIFNEKQLLTIILIDYFKYKSVFDSISFHFNARSIYLKDDNLPKTNVPLLEDLFTKIDKRFDFYREQTGGALSVKSFTRIITEKFV